MKNRLKNMVYPLLALAVFSVAQPVLAEMPGTRPLVVVRFNQARVYYEQSLYQAIAKAVEAKSSVMFDVVSAAPSTGNAAVDVQWQQASEQHTQQVVASMQRMGVPRSRMTISAQPQPGLTADEVRIYVR